MSVAPVDPRQVVESNVQRAYSSREAVSEWLDAIFRVSMDTCGREFTEREFAGRTSRAAFSRKAYGR